MAIKPLAVASWGLIARAGLLPWPSAVPVKTLVMMALEAVLRSEISEVKIVERRDPIGTDLSKVNLPALYLYEVDETGAKANRLRRGEILVEMAVFIRLIPGKDHGFQAFYDTADIIAGRVYAVLQSSSELDGLVLQSEEELRHKAIGNESFGELVLRYRITYGHPLGNAFTTQI